MKAFEASATATLLARESKLLGPLQSNSITVIEGQSLRLLCALAYDNRGNEIKWTFGIRSTASSAKPIALDRFHNQLEILNVTQQEHDGYYKCSSSTDYQVGRFYIERILIL